MLQLHFFQNVAAKNATYTTEQDWETIGGKQGL